MEKDLKKYQNSQEYNKFVNQIKSNYILKTKEQNVIFDTKWVDKFEEIFPNIDIIIRNPRRFIIQEEDIAPIEKTKKVTQESIKHLAQHSHLIQDIEDDGFVRPAKLLNVYKEDTFDLYENRFIYSLVKNINIFIQKVIIIENYDSFAKSFRESSYTGETNINGEKVNFNLNVQINKKENKNININNNKPLKERIDYLKRIVSEFVANPFIKSLSQAVPVKSPIRKTNVFLKDKNFKKALELWEFLEEYQSMDLTKTENLYNEDMDVNKKNDFDLLSYISYNIISGNKLDDNDTPVIDDDYLYKFIENYVLENDSSEKEFKRYINRLYKQAVTIKKKREKDLVIAFDKIAQKFKENKEKALKLMN